VAPMVVWHSPCESRTLPGTQHEKPRSSSGVFYYLKFPARRFLQFCTRHCPNNSPSLRVQFDDFLFLSSDPYLAKVVMPWLFPPLIITIAATGDDKRHGIHRLSLSRARSCVCWGSTIWRCLSYLACC